MTPKPRPDTRATGLSERTQVRMRGSEDAVVAGTIGKHLRAHYRELLEAPLPDTITARLALLDRNER